ncbi:hypothetical protein FHS96_003744 [Sphingomonas zeicaulis]
MGRPSDRFEHPHEPQAATTVEDQRPAAICSAATARSPAPAGRGNSCRGDGFMGVRPVQVLALQLRTGRAPHRRRHSPLGCVTRQKKRPRRQAETLSPGARSASQPSRRPRGTRDRWTRQCYRTWRRRGCASMWIEVRVCRRTSRGRWDGAAISAIRDASGRTPITPSVMVCSSRSRPLPLAPISAGGSLHIVDTGSDRARHLSQRWRDGPSATAGNAPAHH